MSEATVLSAPDANIPYTLCTDASGIGIGAVLEQEQQGEVRPIAYYSRKLQPRETKYSATELDQRMRRNDSNLFGEVKGQNVRLPRT